MAMCLITTYGAKKALSTQMSAYEAFTLDSLLWLICNTSAKILILCIKFTGNSMCQMTRQVKNYISFSMKRMSYKRIFF